MAELPTAYNSETNKESMADFSALPAGLKIAAIYKSQYKATKAKTGHMLQLQLKVLEGKDKGRVFFENLNLDNPNPVAVEIANKTLNSICQACLKASVKDSEELHNIPMRVTLRVDAATATQPASNSVTNYQSYDGEMVEESPAVPNSGEATSTPVTKKLPWEK